VPRALKGSFLANPLGLGYGFGPATGLHGGMSYKVAKSGGVPTVVTHLTM
jgi:hypothetical protein